jgi:hypothetical protein
VFFLAGIRVYTLKETRMCNKLMDFAFIAFYAPLGWAAEKVVDAHKRRKNRPTPEAKPDAAAGAAVRTP